MKRFFQRAYHFLERIRKESKAFPKQYKAFGLKVAFETFIDGLFPPGKSPRYIATIEHYVDKELANLVKKYEHEPEIAVTPYDNPAVDNNKVPIWCCWWQGEEQMPELVKMCHTRLKQVIPEDKAKLYLITIDNYRDFVSIPEHIEDKFSKGIVTMTTMSDVLRHHLMERYGGYWLDATVFFTDAIPKEYFSGQFYCQRMASDYEKVAREACKGNWCGFSMAAPRGNVVSRFMKDAFALWWEKYDTIIEYVLIDYMLLTGFKYVSAIHEMIDRVPDNNEDIFVMYQVLNQPYSEELYQKVTRKNVMHKLTYKIDLRKYTEDGQLTLYGYLLDDVYSANDIYDGI